MFLLTKDFWNILDTGKKGRGVFAQRPIKQGSIIGDYLGKLVRLKDVDFDKEKKNMYLMYYNDNAAIYPDLKNPGVYLLNHSCSPNCWIYKYKGHSLFFALKNINVGDELTISYLLPPRNICKNCTHYCFCGSKYCTKTMHLTEEKYKFWQEFQKKQDNKIKPEGTVNKKYLVPLSKYPKVIPKSYIRKIIKLGI